MRFGCCAGVDGISAVEDAGYDYVELPVSAVLAEVPDSEWKAVRGQIAGHAIKPEAWNVMVPREIRLVGPDVGWSRIRKYLSTAFGRISEVGGRVVVFGSGAARRVPEGFHVSEAAVQLREFIRLVGDAAHRNALRVAIEPLNRAETNIINSIAEAVAYASALNHPAVGVLVDFYHMNEEHEPASAVLQARHYLMHVHTADTGRRCPGSGSYDHTAFFDALRAAGYEGRVSVECSWGTDQDAERRAALEFLKCCDSLR